MINCEKSAHLYPPYYGTFSAFHYMFYIFMSGYNLRTIQDIKIKFSAFLSLVEAKKCVKFQSARCTGFKVAIFRKSHIMARQGFSYLFEPVALEFGIYSV